MSGIKIERNGSGDQVVFSSVLRWVAGVASVVVSAVVLAGVFGIFNQALATRDNTKALSDLAVQFHSFAEANAKQWEEERLFDAKNQLRFDQLKARVTRLDKRREP